MFLPRIYIYIKKTHTEQKNKEIPGREGQKKPGAYRLWPPKTIEVLKYNFRLKTAQAKADEHNQAMWASWKTFFTAADMILTAI